MSSPISSTQFKGSSEIAPPSPYSTNTNTSIGAATSWKSPAGAPLGKRNLGSNLSFNEDSGSNPIPKSDRGMGRNEE
jgi:hypothetical protein